MTLVLDTRTLPESDRREALTALLDGTEIPTAHRFDDASGGIHHRVEIWSLGTGCHLNRMTGTGIGVSRGPKQLRMAAPERVGLSLQSGVVGRFAHLGQQQLIGGGEFSLTDGTSPSDFSWRGVGVAQTVVLDYAQIGLPIDVVRAAAPRLRASPLYELVRDHVVDLFALGDALEQPSVQKMLKAATTDAVRTLIVTAARGDERARPTSPELLHRQITHYIHEHVRDRGLTADRIARAHGISVRKLYQVWSANDVPLAEWIVSARLEGARRELRLHPTTAISTVAGRWGFADATHFARRFHRAYGQSPRQWRNYQTERSPRRDGAAN